MKTAWTAPSPRRTRQRTKLKKLDSICESLYAQNHANSKYHSGDDENKDETAFEPVKSTDLRRSSRIRRAPVVLDLSPTPAKRRKGIESSWEESKCNEYRRKLRFSDVQEESEDSENLKTLGNWHSRLRSSNRTESGEKIGKTKRFEDIIAKENDDGFRFSSFDEGAEGWSNEKIVDYHSAAEEEGQSDTDTLQHHNTELVLNDEACGLENMNGPICSTEIGRLMNVSGGGLQDVVHDESTSENDGAGDESNNDAEDEKNIDVRLETNDEVVHEPNDDEVDIEESEPANICEINTTEVEQVKVDGDEDTNRVETQKPFNKVRQSDAPRKSQGRRCGLCGCGNDGKPPKKLVVDATGSENDGYSGSSASEEMNYDIWDGFGDEPEWLGRLLGPVNDRFGIAGVWVHQHCAVWSPEVYFAGLGRLKSVRAALCRGRALKCSRCGRPGATIGCRVDRCPKTYHLPCARLNGCIFNHKKFLIACTDHKHLFQPHGSRLIKRIKMLKAKKMKLELRKKWHDAWRKDLDAEEKWMENCGEDEEFLKRENRRLQRDLQRLAPSYIGGSQSDGTNGYDGWESVAGLKDVIQSLKEVVIIPLLYPHFFTSIGSTPPRGVLLHGHPGTGKTHVVRALIGSCARVGQRIAYFARKGADCLGKYVGDAERQLRLLFQVAEKNQPSIIFFDEIDGLAPCRTRQQDQTHSSVVSTLLALMDGLKSRGSVIVIGATNRPEAIDPALRRPGRFDREIYFPLPAVEDRAAILSLHTQRWPRPVNGDLLNWVAQNTVGFAGADLQALCTQAAIAALKRNFALHDVLSAAGKSEGKLPNLPRFNVEERDWVEALACSPVPCSRRVDGIAVNGVASNPLPVHLLPYFLQPLLKLLAFWYRDERIWVPDSLLRCGALVEKQAASFLDRRSLPTNTWWLHIDELVKEPEAVEELQRELSSAGLVTCEVSRELNVSSASRASRKSLGFRILIGGYRRSGQKHLASSILHSFIGHVTVHKIDLASISHAGHGDVVHGISQILLKCSCLKTCLIFMPRIDLWAVDNSTDSETHNGLNPLIVSQPWLSFMEQMESICVSTALMILATSDVPLKELPEEVENFFHCNKLNKCTSSICHCSVPRFTLHLSAEVSLPDTVRLATTELTSNLIKSYIEIMHHSSHNSLPVKAPTENEAVQTTKDIVFKEGKTDIDVSVKFSNAKGKPSLMVAMSAFGFQILRYPQFAELCWYTSKLREGPLAEVKSFRDWPFNSCIIRPLVDLSKVDENDDSKKGRYGVVRGLVAVGLSAYRGEYRSLKETSFQVSRAISILVQDINRRIENGKDRLMFTRLLSQAAYMEDLVKNWAYSLQSVDADVPFLESTDRSNVDETLSFPETTGRSTAEADVPFSETTGRSTADGDAPSAEMTGPSTIDADEPFAEATGRSTVDADEPLSETTGHCPVDADEPLSETTGHYPVDADVPLSETTGHCPVDADVPLSETTGRSTGDADVPFAETTDRSTVDTDRPIAEMNGRSTFDVSAPFFETNDRSAVDASGPLFEGTGRSTVNADKPFAETTGRSAVDADVSFPETTGRSIVDADVSFSETTGRSTVDADVSFPETTGRSTVDSDVSFREATGRSTVDADVIFAQTTGRSTVDADVIFAQTTDRSTVNADVIFAETTGRSIVDADVIFAETSDPSTVNADVPCTQTSRRSLGDGGIDTLPIGPSVKSEKANDLNAESAFVSINLEDELYEYGKNHQRNDPSSVCKYDCCAGCVGVVYRKLESIVKGKLGGRNDWSAEEMHDIFASLSVTLMSTVRKGVYSVGADTDSSCCRHADTIKDAVVEPKTCSPHLSEKFRFSGKISFLFREGVLVPSGTIDFQSFHCEYVSVCLCRLSQILLI